MCTCARERRGCPLDALIKTGQNARALHGQEPGGCGHAAKPESLGGGATIQLSCCILSYQYHQLPSSGMTGSGANLGKGRFCNCMCFLYFL